MPKAGSDSCSSELQDPSALSRNSPTSQRKARCFAPAGYQTISIIEKFRAAVPAIIACHPGNGKISEFALLHRPASSLQPLIPAETQLPFFFIVNVK